jgi:type IV pilus assembly protein PilP
VTVSTMSQSRRNGPRRIAGLRNRSRFGAWALITLCLVLSGCSSDKFEDLRNYVQQVRSMQKSHIEPLPEFKPFETFTYNDSAKKDPFEPWDTAASALARAGANGVKPNFNRRKESLEAFPLDSLHMVGTLDFNHQKWAAIKAPDGIVYRVKSGNYMGRNNGEVTKIEDGKVVLREIVPNGLGGWEQRQALLTIKD